MIPEFWINFILFVLPIAVFFGLEGLKKIGLANKYAPVVVIGIGLIFAVAFYYLQGTDFKTGINLFFDVLASGSIYGLYKTSIKQ